MATASPFDASTSQSEPLPLATPSISTFDVDAGAGVDTDVGGGAVDFDALKKCVTTVEKALHGTDWEKAMKEVTRLCFSSLWIAFTMARRVHPTFPTIADWSVLQRMKSPQNLRKGCLYERKNPKYGEPKWDASCFEAGHIELGTDSDIDSIYVRSSTGKWERTEYSATAETKNLLAEYAKVLMKKYTASSDEAQTIDTEIMKLIGSSNPTK